MAVHFFEGAYKLNRKKKKIAVEILPALCFDNYYFGLVAFFFLQYIVRKKKRKDSDANSKASHGKNEYSKRC